MFVQFVFAYWQVVVVISGPGESLTPAMTTRLNQIKNVRFSSTLICNVVTACLYTVRCTLPAVLLPSDEWMLVQTHIVSQGDGDCRVSA